MPKPELFQEGEIQRVSRRPDDDVASGSAVAADEIVVETRRVEPLRRIVGEVVRIARHVGPGAGLGAGKLQARGWIERITGLHAQNAVGLPAAQSRTHHSGTRRSERAALPIGKVIRVAGDPAVTGVKRRETALQVEVRDGHGGAVPQRPMSIDFEKV